MGGPEAGHSGEHHAEVRVVPPQPEDSDALGGCREGGGRVDASRLGKLRGSSPVVQRLLSCLALEAAACAETLQM